VLPGKRSKITIKFKGSQQNLSLQEIWEMNSFFTSKSIQYQSVTIDNLKIRPHHTKYMLKNMANMVLFKNDITKIFIKMNKVGHEMQDRPIQVMEITYATPEFSRPHWMAACQSQTKILAETLRFKSDHKMACIVVCFAYNTRA
jgi:hypothetical protein